MVAPSGGVGGPEAPFVIERVADLVADATGLDPAEVRRRNFIPPDAFPFTTQTGVIYDSGEYAKALAKVLEACDYDGLKHEQETRRQSGDRHQLGIGLSTYVEICG